MLIKNKMMVSSDVARLSPNSRAQTILLPQAMLTFEIRAIKLAPVAHRYDLSYSGGRDHENSSLKPAQVKGKKFARSHLKKRADIKAQGVGPEFKPV
jgi:hypothetical protein